MLFFVMGDSMETWIGGKYLPSAVRRDAPAVLLSYFSQCQA